MMLSTLHANQWNVSPHTHAQAVPPAHAQAVVDMAAKHLPVLKHTLAGGERAPLHSLTVKAMPMCAHSSVHFCSLVHALC